MASQTGTLKFRQSDGTYTELYPKTTIAQVDGLQTQLDSINTSLQNKVDYNNTTKDMHMVAKYFNLDSFSYGAYLSLTNENNEPQGAISIIQNESTDYKIKPFFIDYITSKALIIASKEYIIFSLVGARFVIVSCNPLSVSTSV